MQRSIAVLLVSLVLVGAALGASDERWATSEHMAEHAEELGLNGHFKAGEEHAFFFTLFDANQDGYLDGHELRLSLHDTKAHDEGMPKVKALETRVDEMLRKYDVDRDGRLSLGESLSMQ